MFLQKIKLKINIFNIMKKSIILLSSLFLTLSTTMQAQDRPQPKPGPAPK
jgi:hypothetical protein